MTQSNKKSLEVINHNTTQAVIKLDNIAITAQATNTKLDELIELSKAQIIRNSDNVWKLIFTLLALTGAIIGMRAI